MTEVDEMIDLILDIDSVGDDILAVLYALQHEKLNVLGITTVLGASGCIEQATKVALNTVALTGKKVPVYKGAGAPMGKGILDTSGDPVNFDETMRWKFGDRLDRFNEPAEEPEAKEEDLHAVDYIIQTVNERPGEVVLVTTGSLTNIGLALEKDPSIAKKIKKAYILGGVFRIPGNITPVVEYNIFADPEAAKIVLNSDMDKILVPLDVCENNEFADSMLTRDHLADMQHAGLTKITEYVVYKFPIYIDMWREYFQLGGFPMDDVITVALAADESLCTYTDSVFVDVELEGKLTRGQTIAYFGYQILKNECVSEKTTKIARTVAGKRFMNDFVEKLILPVAPVGEV